MPKAQILCKLPLAHRLEFEESSGGKYLHKIESSLEPALLFFMEQFVSTGADCAIIIDRQDIKKTRDFNIYEKNIKEASGWDRTLDFVHGYFRETYEDLGVSFNTGGSVLMSDKTSMIGDRYSYIKGNKASWDRLNSHLDEVMRFQVCHNSVAWYLHAAKERAQVELNLRDVIENCEWCRSFAKDPRLRKFLSYFLSIFYSYKQAKVAGLRYVYSDDKNASERMLEFVNDLRFSRYSRSRGQISNISGYEKYKSEVEMACFKLLDSNIAKGVARYSIKFVSFASGLPKPDIDLDFDPRFLPPLVDLKKERERAELELLRTSFSEWTMTLPQFKEWEPWKR